MMSITTLSERQLISTNPITPTNKRSKATMTALNKRSYYARLYDCLSPCANRHWHVVFIGYWALNPPSSLSTYLGRLPTIIPTINTRILKSPTDRLYDDFKRPIWRSCHTGARNYKRQLNVFPINLRSRAKYFSGMNY